LAKDQADNGGFTSPGSVKSLLSFHRKAMCWGSRACGTGSYRLGNDSQVGLLLNLYFWAMAVYLIPTFGVF